MIEELLRKFSRENFGDVNYEPFLHGYSETARKAFAPYNQTKGINMETSLCES